ncbi:STY4528 family pathogenicity island replication protein [Pseudomonas quasicaspiana]|uniref:STY4528 family pathogenicity island replication protein n=1 Tax=Pseudomonas quasicaspiana TaxID=2829821 RepID=UPI001E28CC43|nr:STY4528 family pathogenicity island replication protein [Pseudomonas quasicaspiana]
MKMSRRPSLGGAINAAAGALQNHLLLQQLKLAQQQSTGPDSKNPITESRIEETYDGIVFSGNPHETVPRSLLLDDRLSPLERNAWQVFRLLINSDGITAFPTYEQLRPYLGSVPGKSASRETVAKALTVLRLTRWLSLGRRVRDSISGRVQGNVYILHDEPVGCVEAMELDRDYMLLIGQALEHANKAVRTVADLAFKEFASDPNHSTGALPTRLDVIEGRWRKQGWHDAPNAIEQGHSKPEFGIRTQEGSGSFSLSSDSELSENRDQANPEKPSSESELSLKSASFSSVRIPNSYSTYTNTNTSVCKSSVPRETQIEQVDLPSGFERFTQDQRDRAITALQRVQPDLRKPLLDQWLHRCKSGTVNNPFGYLLSCMQKALSGEFNAQWQAPPTTVKNPQETVAESKPPNAPRDQPSHPAQSAVTRSSPQSRDESSLLTGRNSMLTIKQLVRPRTPR